MYKVIIIGSGPAGATCANYLIDANINPLIIDNNNSRLDKATISNFYPFINVSGRELLNISKEELIKKGVTFLSNDCLDIRIENNFIVKTKNMEFESEYLVLAFGSSDNIPASFNKYLGNGLSICALCDGPLYKGKTIYLTGDSKTIPNDLEELKHYTDDVRLIDIKDIESLKGESNLEGIFLKNGNTIETNNLFYSSTPTSKSLYYKLGLITKDNLVKVNENYESNIPKLYAIGDISNKIKQVASATYSGMMSAIDIIRRINSENN